MNEKEIIREIMSIRKWSQKELAKEAGFKSQSNVTGLLNNNKNGIRIDNLVKMLNALGCEVIVRDKMGSGKEWKVEL
jgi:DNA-binding Xre family transcriptional regulator